MALLPKAVFFFCVAMLACAGQAATALESIASRSGAAEEEEFNNSTWQEAAWDLPAMPQADELLPFYVSAATNNKFYVDAASLSVGSDGVVRYTLLVLTSGGGRNLGFEGMRCETRERRLYASGRIDGAWSKSRSNQWSRIQDAAANRHYAALFLGYFCPDGVIARNKEEIVAALKRDAAFVGRSQ